jgi:DNA repair protein RAD5
MGKTIMLSALIQMGPGSNVEPASELSESSKGKQRQLKLNSAFRPSSTRKNKARAVSSPKATLIVAPTALLSQWELELQRSSKPGTLRIFVWHGSNRLDLDDLLQEDDAEDVTKPIIIVITSYGVLASEHAKSETSSVFQGNE